MPPRKTVEEEITDLPDEDIDQADEQDVQEPAEPGDALPENNLTDDIGTLEDTPAAEAAAESAPNIEVVDRGRIFKIGSTTLYENEATAGLSNEQVRDLLKDSYPEIANATIGVKSEDGQPVVSFLPQPGRKG